MAINLYNNSMNNIGQGGHILSGQTAGTGQTSSLMQQAALSILREVEGLSAGDTLQGQLVSKDGNSIELLLGNNARLTTQLEQDMNLSLGQLMSFEVKSNQGGQLTLRPLFANMSNSSTIMSALDAAGIAASDTTVEMVDTLMHNGMPINKEMLHTINRELSMYPDADVKDIVMLHKMDIPVNEGNVRQMHLYNNNNQWMLDNVSESASELTGVITDAMAKNPESAKELIAGLKELLTPSLEAETVAAEGKPVEGQAEANAVASGNNMQTVSDGDELAMQARAKAGDNNVINDQVKGQMSDAIQSEVSSMNTEESVADRSNVNEQLSPRLQSASDAQNEIADKQGAATKNITDNQNAINKNNIFDVLDRLDPKELAKPEVKAQVRNALNELLKDNFLMNPKDIKEEKFVQKYYERTLNLADGLQKLMADNGRADSDFARTMGNVKENTTFMNHVNDMYNYVQLPLKMNDSQANGDLYVYARKKGKMTGPDADKLTALLHLSMDHLGTMDIFLTLTEGHKLNTKFTLEKEEMIDFIASHIDELNARLAKKGYNAGTVVCMKDEPDKTAIENIVGRSDNILLSTQSFDARA